MTTISDPVIGPIAATLLACLADEANKIPDPPATPRVVCLRPGDRIDLLLSQTEDECCSGLMWVRWNRIYPSGDGFPAADNLVGRCGIERWAVEFELGAVRCAPVGDVDTLPTCDEWEATTLGTYDDGAAIRRALCCFISSSPYSLVFVGDGLPMTTEGGCVGVTYKITVAADNCDCPEV